MACAIHSAISMEPSPCLATLIASMPSGHTCSKPKEQVISQGWWHAQAAICNRRSGQLMHQLLIICSPAAAHGTTAPVFRYPGDHNFDLSEYMVVLDKPIGLTLAPDPTTGQVGPHSTSALITRREGIKPIQHACTGDYDTLKKITTQ